MTDDALLPGQSSTKLHVVSGEELGRQAFVCGSARLSPPDQSKFVPVEASPRPCSKPRSLSVDRRSGGLWTSTFDERYGSGWVQWCQGEQWGYADAHEGAEPRWQTWVLDPEQTARIARIACYADLAALVAAYPQTEHSADRGYGEWSESCPAWHLIAEDFDAVNLTENGQWDTRLSHPLSLYGWDCESTLWLRWAFVAIEDAGVRTYAERYDEDDDAKATAEATSHA